MEPSSVKIIRALNNDVRRAILASICDNTCSVNELAVKLGSSNIDFKSRDSLYKQLEILVNAGLLEKFYDVEKKAISYKNPIAQVVIDIEKLTVEIRKEENKAVRA
jgi:predicted transcriptional regulator